jgi:hypothetical protein
MQKLLVGLSMVLLIVSCTTNNGSQSTGVPTQTLMPLQAGNSWIYVDSLFSDAGTYDTAYSDTVVINSLTTSFSDPDETVSFFGISDPNGWFGTGTYMGVDQNNTVLYQLDSTGQTPDVFFETATTNGSLLGQGSGLTYTSCPVTYNLYGFTTPVVIGGRSCLENTEVTINCNGANVENINTYLDPGIGVVRIEDYELDSAGTSININFTQTLQSYTFN